MPRDRPAYARQARRGVRRGIRADGRNETRDRDQQRHERARDHLSHASASMAAKSSCRRTRSSPRRRPSQHAGGRVRFAECDPGDLLRSTSTHARSADRRRRPRAVVVVHIGGIVTPRIARAADGLRRRRRPAGRGRRARARQHARAASPPAASGWRRRSRSTRRRSSPRGEGGMIATDDERIDERGAHLPRPGQGRLHVELPHAARQQLAHERAARGHRPLAAQAAAEFIAARQRIAAIYDRAAARRLGVEPLRDAARASTATTTSTSRCRRPASTAPR